MADNQENLFKRWIAEHSRLIFKIVKAYAASPEDQDDLFQEIALQLWSSIPNFQGDAKETTWIYRVALNTAMVWRRGEVRKRRKHHKLLTDFNNAPDNQQSSFNPLPDGQILDQLYTAIRQLPKVDSSVVLMYLDGISYDDITEVLGISKSNVGVKLNRAKKKLAKLLKGIIDDF